MHAWPSHTLFPVFSILEKLGIKNPFQITEKSLLTLGITVSIVCFDTLLSIRFLNWLKCMEREGLEPSVNKSY
jgi:hypothetical protein